MTNLINFRVDEQQSSLAVSTTNAAGSFKTPAGIAARDCMIVNYGSAGAQIAFSTATATAVSTSAAGGTVQVYVPAGAVMIVNKNICAFFAATTDASTTNLVFHAGVGN